MISFVTLPTKWDLKHCGESVLNVSVQIPKGPPTISDYALVRRQFHIFERALKKFKSDIGLWIQYIQVAKKEGARSLVGRITARALQLFPNVPAFYILAASHELEYLSPSAARTLLQRGIRLNAESVEMWREYVKMEMGFVESMRRRWNVLGIIVEDKGKGKERERTSLDEEEVEQMEVDAAEPEGDESEAARREILSGAIVKSVISSAAKALPKPELFMSLHNVISKYPSPLSLRTSLLDHLHDLLQQILPHDAQAIKLTATRFLTPEVEGAELVDRLKEANETLSRAVKDAISNGRRETREEREALDALAQVYGEFINEWCRKDELDPSLKAYLLGSLHSLIQFSIDSEIPLSSLLSTHLALLTYFSTFISSGDVPLLPSPTKIVKLARKYTSLPAVRSSYHIWLARLEAEKRLLGPVGGKDGEVEKTWKEARANVSGEGVIEVWIWGVNVTGEDANKHGEVEESVKVLESLLGESLRMQDSSSWKTVHEKLLEHYASLVIKNTLDSSSEGSQVPKQLSQFIQRIKLSYIPTSRVWEHMFSLTSSLASSTDTNAVYPLLQLIRANWHALDISSSSLTYATWLLQNDRAKESVEVIKGALKALEGGERVEFETSWRKVLDKCSSGGQEDEDEQVEKDDVAIDVDVSASS
ncbi:unnamed protein product [Somion occarium]|uniref:Uncharacterized protein n=1 Tax=Somion occarium TaxID=3059160 RepID=A0ABP1DIS9_9APHY